MATPSKKSNESLLRDVVEAQAAPRHGPKEARLLDLLTRGTSKEQDKGSTSQASDPEMETIIREMFRAGMLQVAGDVVPIKPTAPGKPEPSAAEQEAMKSIDQMIGAMRKPPLR